MRSQCLSEFYPLCDELIMAEAAVRECNQQSECSLCIKAYLRLGLNIVRNWYIKILEIWSVPKCQYLSLSKESTEEQKRVFHLHTFVFCCTLFTLEHFWIKYIFCPFVWTFPCVSFSLFLHYRMNYFLLTIWICKLLVTIQSHHDQLNSIHRNFHILVENLRLFESIFECVKNELDVLNYYET